MRSMWADTDKVKQTSWKGKEKSIAVWVSFIFSFLINCTLDMLPISVRILLKTLLSKKQEIENKWNAQQGECKKIPNMPILM